MRLRLVVPCDVDTPTGGNVYDLAVADALRSGGDEVEVRRSAPAGLSRVLEEPWDGHMLVDGLLAAHQPQALADTRAAVLVHMPLALQTGLPRDRAVRLDALERQALHEATLVVTTSRWCARYVERHHGRAGVVVVPPGVDPAPVGTGSNPPLLVHLAALLPHKDQVGVVAALAELADLPWQARLAGPTDHDPDYTRAVRDAVHAAGLDDRVEIPGPMPRAAAWAGADLALLPSYVESYGMVVTEALARGVPVVVGEGGAAEALGVAPTGERPGIVVPAGEPDTLAAVLRRWLTDHQLRDALVTAALARRTTLEPWGSTARRLRDVLTRG